MNIYGLMLFSHVIVVVYLLGADLGRAWAAFQGAAPTTAPQARMLAARAALWLGSVTNAALVLIMPIGVGLGGALGAYRITGIGWLTATVLVTLGWLALSIAADRAADGPGGGRRLALADTIARVVIGLGNISDGALVFAGTSQTVEAKWLGTKVAAYGVLILLTIPARRAGFDMRRELVLLQAVPEDQGASARLAAAMGRLPRPVMGGWLLVLLAAWMGAAKPV